MRFVHTMIRVFDLEKAIDFWVHKMNFKQVHRMDNDAARFSLIFLEDGGSNFILELTYNWDQEEEYSFGRNFGHLAFKVDNIYKTCEELQNKGITILRPPRDGHMAFIKAPDNVSIELLQEGESLPPQEPWLSMENTGTW